MLADGLQRLLLICVNYELSLQSHLHHSSTFDHRAQYAHQAWYVWGALTGCFVEYGYTKAKKFPWRALFADNGCEVQSKFNTVGNIILW
jgi:hypothetical protein